MLIRGHFPGFSRGIYLVVCISTFRSVLSADGRVEGGLGLFVDSGGANARAKGLKVTSSLGMEGCQGELRGFPAVLRRFGGIFRVCSGGILLVMCILTFRFVLGLSGGGG